MFKNIISIILSFVVLAYIVVIVVDYVRTTKKEEPYFCIEKYKYDFGDGPVNACMGLGYKIYDYNRKSIEGMEMVPFWKKMKDSYHK